MTLLAIMLTLVAVTANAGTVPTTGTIEGTAAVETLVWHDEPVPVLVNTYTEFPTELRYVMNIPSPGDHYLT